MIRVTRIHRAPVLAIELRLQISIQQGGSPVNSCVRIQVPAASSTARLTSQRWRAAGAIQVFIELEL